MKKTIKIDKWKFSLSEDETHLEIIEKFKYQYVYSKVASPEIFVLFNELWKAKSSSFQFIINNFNFFLS